MKKLIVGGIVWAFIMGLLIGYQAGNEAGENKAYKDLGWQTATQK
jgi:hypothetical protein